MKSSPTAIVAMLVLTCVLPMVPGAPSFEGGQGEYTVDLVAPGFEATVNIEIPAGYYATNSTMNVTGMAAAGNSSAYPEGVQVLVNDSLIWTFNEIGYGPLGRQDEFSTGSNMAQTEFGAEGGINKLWIRLPKAALVQSARMEMAGFPLIKWQELVSFTGANAYDILGVSVSSAGDVNKDGYDDVIVGAHLNDAGGTNAGQAYIYFSGPNMDTTADVVLTGEAAGDEFGYSVSGAGDVNKDGYHDVIVGSHDNDAGGTDAGRAYIYYGGPNMDSTADVVLTGAATGDFFGYSVSGAGDVNKDGYDDVIVGAYGNDAGGTTAGRAYIYYSGPSMDSVADVILTGAAAGDYFGWSVSGAGDVNKDSYDDVIVGAPLNDGGGTKKGRAYVYYGGASMDSTADVVLTGEGSDDSFGYSVSGAGDVNDDGSDDVVIGAGRNDDNGANAGKAYVYCGGALMDSSSDASFKGVAAGDLLGWSVSGAGDVNKDGFDDIILGAHLNSAGGTWAGQAYICYGGKNLDNTTDATFTGAAADDRLGNSVSSAGDMNNDGYDDVVVGAYDNDGGGTDSGRAYVFSFNYIQTKGVLDPAVRLGSTTVWNAAGIFNGTAASIDFAKTVNDFLGTASPSGTDGSGNAYVNIPINASANSGGTLKLFNLSITYQYTANIPNFATSLNGYLAAHQGKKDGNGNIIVPITVRSQTAGKVKLSGLSFSRDLPPAQTSMIKALELDEDTGIVPFLDLYKYFQDDRGSSNMNFSVVSSTNSSLVRLWITAKRYLSVDAMTGDQNDNWTGTVEAVVACNDTWNQSTVSNQFTIVVKNVNDPPVFTSTPVMVAAAGVPYFYNVTACDVENDPVRFSLATAPSNMTIEPVTGRIQWMPRARGNHTVVIKATDGNASVEQNFTIFVPNVPPRITSTPPLNATVGVPYSYPITTEDENGDSLSFYLSGDISIIAVLTPNNVITLTPTNLSSLLGSISVSDGLATVYQNFTIIVSPAAATNHAPQFKSTPIPATTVDTLYIYNASAADPDNDTLTFSLESGPSGMTVDPATGKVAWTPSAAGNFTVVIKVSDGKGAEAKQEFVINVSAPAIIRPQLVLVSHQPGQTVKGTITISGTVTKGSRDVSKVQLRIDGKDWTDAAGNYSWSYQLNTKSLKNGMHTFEFRAYDGKEYSDVVKAELKIDNQAAAGKGFIPMMDGLIALSLLGVAAAVSVLRRRH